MKLNKIELHSFAILLIGCIVGSLSIIPYITELHTAEESFNILLDNILIYSVVVYTTLTYFSFRLTRSLPLDGTPTLDRTSKFILN